MDGVTREVPAPFLVIATQNPSGSTGTQYLPEAQVDRFMVSLSLGYPDFESELAMAKSISAEDRLEKVETVLDDWTLLKMQEEIHDVFVRDRVYAYILELIRATRENPHFERGASPRGTIALVKMAKAAAYLAGRDYVIPADVEEQLYYVSAHRVMLSGAARMEGLSVRQVLEEITGQVRKPPVGERRRP